MANFIPPANGASQSLSQMDRETALQNLIGILVWMMSSSSRTFLRVGLLELLTFLCHWLTIIIMSLNLLPPILASLTGG